MSELISIIVPVHNGERYVKQCTDMLKAQDYPNLEFIVVNDGSTDNTLRLFEQYTAGDERFHIISRPNGGVSLARNAGVSASHGKYISFVDEDDYIYPYYTSHMYDLLTGEHANMVCGNTFKTHPTKTLPSFEYDGTVLVFRGIEAVINMLYRKQISSYPVCKLIKADLVWETPFIENIAYGEDTIFNYQLMQKAEKVVFSSRILYLYYQQETSANHMFDQSKVEPSWNAFIEYIANSKKAKKPGVRKAVSAKGFVYASDFCTRIGKGDREQQIYDTLRTYIRQNCAGVRKDKNCKKINRFMALLAEINTDLYLSVCRSADSFKKKAHIELKHSL